LIPISFFNFQSDAPQHHLLAQFDIQQFFHMDNDDGNHNGEQNVIIDADSNLQLPINPEAIISRMLGMLQSNFVVDQQVPSPSIWLNLTSFPIPMALNPYDDDYEFNTFIGDVLGKVEIGLTDSEINDVSVEVDKPDLDKDNERCPICLEHFADLDRKLRKLECTHVYCDDCIREWLKKHKKCPYCQIDLEDTYLKKTETKI
jgi:hypothetical protein